jgi:hypothetical protein
MHLLHLLMPVFLLPTSSFQFTLLQQSSKLKSAAFCDNTTQQRKCASFIDSITDQWSRALSDETFASALRQFELEHYISAWCYDEALRSHTEQIVCFSSPQSHQVTNSNKYAVFETDEPRVLQQKWLDTGVNSFTPVAVSHEADAFVELIAAGWKPSCSTSFVLFESFLTMQDRDICIFLSLIKSYSEIVFAVHKSSENSLLRWLKENHITTLRVSSCPAGAQETTYLVHGFKFISSMRN